MSTLSRKCQAFSFSLVLLFAPVAFSSEGCVAKFAGFFERTFLFIPELSYEAKLRTLGAEIQKDVAQSIALTPESELAKKGISASGICLQAVIEDALNLGGMTQMENQFSVLAIRQDKAATYYLSEAAKPEFVYGNCLKFHQELGLALMKEVSSSHYSGTFENGFYTQKVSGSLFPYRRKLSLTRNGKFLLSRMNIGRTPDGQKLEELCAYPIK